MRPLERAKVIVIFDDGVSGVFDVAPYIRGDFFQPLNDDGYFRQVGLYFTGICWPEGQALGPELVAAELQPLPWEVQSASAPPAEDAPGRRNGDSLCQTNTVSS